MGTLSALAQHAERGTCGVSKFKEVEWAMDAVAGGMRSIAF